MNPGGKVRFVLLVITPLESLGSIAHQKYLSGLSQVCQIQEDRFTGQWPIQKSAKEVLTY